MSATRRLDNRRTAFHRVAEGTHRSTWNSNPGHRLFLRAPHKRQRSLGFSRRRRWLNLDWTAENRTRDESCAGEYSLTKKGGPVRRIKKDPRVISVSLAPQKSLFLGTSSLSLIWRDANRWTNQARCSSRVSAINSIHSPVVNDRWSSFIDQRSLF